MEENLETRGNTTENSALEQRARTMTDRAQELSIRGDFDAALALAEEAFAKAEEAGSDVEMFRALNVQAIVYRNLGSYSRALELFNRALYYCEKRGHIINTATVLGNIGVVYRNLGEYGKSLEYYSRALAISANILDNEIPANILGNIGNVYRNLDDLPRALEYYHKALALAETRGDMLSYARHLGNVGNVYAGMQQFDTALEHYHKALAICENAENRHGIMVHTGNMGNLLFDTGHYDEAIELLRKALALARELGDKQGIAEWTTHIARIFAAPKYADYNPEAAEEYFIESIAIYGAIGDRSGQFKACRELAMLYKRQERWREYAARFEQYHEIEHQVQSLKAKEQAERFAHDRELAVISRERELLSLKNAELEEANSFKSKLLGIAAHDLKNPLGNIIGAANMMIEGLPATSSDREWLDMIVQSARRMHTLIGDLLESSSASLGAMTLSLSTCNVAEIIYTVVELHTHAAALKGQNFSVQTAMELWVEGDAARLFQVIENVVSNAVKYSPHGSTITITAGLNRDIVRVAVRDCGQGLSPDDMSKLFGQFQRLSAQPTGDESSTGLGLHIARHIVELHSGRIWAESEGKEKGATFVIELPAKED